LLFPKILVLVFHLIFVNNFNGCVARVAFALQLKIQNY
jgi:hypothetical protein